MLIENMTLTLDLPQLAAILTLVLLGLVVAARLANGPFLDGLNMARTPTLRRLLVALLFVAPFLALIFAAVSLELAVAVLQREHEAVRNLGLLLTGVIGAGLVAWRNWTTSRQADLQDEALFNDKINAAAEDLAARRQVTTVLKQGDERSVITEWQDDVVTRCAAIDRLEGLARERPEITPRVAALLSVYVRELSKHDLKPKDHGFSDADATVDAVAQWARSLRPIRSDLQKAAQALGRLRRIEGQSELVLDLREANLQGFDLRGLDFAKSSMGGVRLDGAILSEANLQGADLLGAQMPGATLNETQFQRASLWRAQMQRANLREAQMQGAMLIETQMQGADLSETQMQGADLWGAQMQKADLWGAQMQGANFRWAQMQGASLIEAQIGQFTHASEATLTGAGVARVNWMSADLSIREITVMFGDASVKLPFDRPNWWPDVALGFGWPETNSPWHIEFNHWRADPDTYDWSQRRQHYTSDGKINRANRPPEWRPDD